MASTELFQSRTQNEHVGWDFLERKGKQPNRVTEMPLLIHHNVPLCCPKSKRKSSKRCLQVFLKSATCLPGVKTSLDESTEASHLCCLFFPRYGRLAVCQTDRNLVPNLWLSCSVWKQEESRIAPTTQMFCTCNHSVGWLTEL